MPAQYQVIPLIYLMTMSARCTSCTSFFPFTMYHNNIPYHVQKIWIYLEMQHHFYKQNEQHADISNLPITIYLQQQQDRPIPTNTSRERGSATRSDEEEKHTIPQKMDALCLLIANRLLTLDAMLHFCRHVMYSWRYMIGRLYRRAHVRMEGVYRQDRSSACLLAG